MDGITDLQKRISEVAHWGVDGFFGPARELSEYEQGQRDLAVELLPLMFDAAVDSSKKGTET